MSWSHDLNTASWRGIEFETDHVEDSYARRLAEYKYPYRDGAEYEDTGREPRQTKLSAIFLGDTAEADLISLLQEIDIGEAGTFVHPLLGTWNARIKSANARHSHEKRDQASVDLEIVEDQLDSRIETVFATVSALQFEIDTWTLSLRAPTWLDKLAAIYDTVAGAIEGAIDFANSIKDAIGDIVSKVDAVRKKIAKAVAAVRSLVDIKNWPVVRALKRLGHACQKLGKAVRSLYPPLLIEELKTSLPLALFAHKKYGDRRRAAEIRRMNKIKNPFQVPNGLLLKSYAR